MASVETTEEKKSGKRAGKPKKKRMLTINLTNSKYDSVRRVSVRFGLRPVADGEEWDVYWTDTSILLERVLEMKRYQKINHFPGMSEICRKDLLARNMNRMLKLFPKDYNCFPRSWCLPSDYGDFQAYCRANSKKNKLYISKPENGCQGKGIFIFKNPKEIRPGEHAVVQQYISRPFLIDSFKFDFRIYVLVTSCDPLRVYVYKDGLGRFATIKYREPTPGNLSEQYMHLTNYAINKLSKDFVRDDDVGSKRRITTVNKWFAENGYDVDKIWHDIEDVIIKTLIAAHPIVKHNYRSCFPNHNKGSACFEVLGFDIMLDKKLKPWLLEVNHSPSFHTDASLDKEVKEGLLHDAFDLIDLYTIDKRKCIEEDKRRVKERLLQKRSSKETTLGQSEEDSREKYRAHLESYEKKHLGGYRRIYPNGNEEHYAKFFDQSTSLCAETAASRARIDLAKQQREEIAAKQKISEQYRKKLAPASEEQGKGKSDSVRPESPTTCQTEKKEPLKINRRGMTFRVLQYGAQSQREQQKERNLKSGESTVPSTEGAAPQQINDTEELERLAGLQLRESLVRGLGVSEQLQATLNTPGESRAQSTLPDAHQPTSIPPKGPLITGTQSSLFFTHHTTYNAADGRRDSGIDVSMENTPLHYSESHSVPTGATPLHSLPGHSSGHMSKTHHLLPSSTTSKRTYSFGSKSYLNSSAQSLAAAYNRPPYAFGTSLSYRPPPHPNTLGPTFRGQLTRPMRMPPSLDLNPELFGLSVISAPIRLATRKRLTHHGHPSQHTVSHETDSTFHKNGLHHHFTTTRDTRQLNIY